MLFEEWKKGTGFGDYDEYKYAEKLYTAMGDSFNKDSLYMIRKSMTKDDFMYLCLLCASNEERLSEERRRAERLTSKEIFVDRMITTLRDECGIDVLKTYATYMAEKAKAEETERIQSLWLDLKGEKTLS